MTVLSADILQAHVRDLLARPALVLATVDEQGEPQASHAPFVFVAEDNALFVLLSGLSPHTRCLRAQARADVLLMQDEAQVRNVFARARLNYAVTARAVLANEAGYDAILQAMQAKLGNTVAVLAGLSDFVLFRLQPQRARLILGFGQAYVFEPGQLQSAIRLDAASAAATQ